MYGDSNIPYSQRGAALVVSMLLLLVMTVLSLSASQSTRMEERMAGNARDLAIAFQAGEASVRSAEKRIATVIAPKGAGRLICSDRDTCDAQDRATAPEDYVHQRQDWWDENGYTPQQSLAEVHRQPQFFTEEWADVPDTLTTGGRAPRSGTLYFVNTARAHGGTPNALAVIETTYAVRY